MKYQITWLRWALFIGLLASSATWAFKPGIHEDISADAVEPIARTVDGEDLRFTEKAIIEIGNANSRTDLSTDFLRPFKHFDNELFSDAAQHLITLRGSVVSRVTAASPDGEKARQDLGTALHTLQDFYAHSNWWETGRSGINTYLGRSVMANPPASTAFCTCQGTLAVAVPHDQRLGTAVDDGQLFDSTQP